MSLSKLIEVLKQNDIANIIISDPYSIHYFTDYFNNPGERFMALLVRSDGEAFMFLNDLFPPFNTAQATNIRTIAYQDGEPIISELADCLLPGPTSIDKYWPSAFLLELQTLSPDLNPVNRTDLVDTMRSIKSDEEIAIMREASRLNDYIMEQVIAKLEQDPLTERQMSDYIKNLYAETGHSGVSFEPIIAYGAHGADPHHVNGNTTLQYGDVVVIDIGGTYKGYASDMTRTIFVGTPDPTALEVYRIVRRANEEAIESVAPGIPLSDIDTNARRIIEVDGYGQYFTHRLGHFIGQEAHEAGDVSKYNHNLTEVGQVFSIEPGVYVPNKFGVRIEDLVVVTEEGYENLNHFTKEPVIIHPNLSREEEI